MINKVLPWIILVAISSLAISIYTHRRIELQYEVVTTPEAMAKGLSGRDHLDPGHAMLFKWQNDDIRCMWAKDMKFDVDLFFLNEYGDTVERMDLKAGDLRPHCSSIPVRYVLETNVGEVKRE